MRTLVPGGGQPDRAQGCFFFRPPESLPFPPLPRPPPPGPALGCGGPSPPCSRRPSPGCRAMRPGAPDGPPRITCGYCTKLIWEPIKYPPPPGRNECTAGAPGRTSGRRSTSSCPSGPRWPRPPPPREASPPGMGPPRVPAPSPSPSRFQFQFRKGGGRTSRIPVAPSPPSPFSSHFHFRPSIRRMTWWDGREQGGLTEGWRVGGLPQRAGRSESHRSAARWGALVHQRG